MNGTTKVRTLGEALGGGGARENSFDTIRLLAAILVLVSHSFPIVTGSNRSEPLFMLSRGQATLGMLSVGAFFVISGLLISNSFDQSRTLYSFTRKRVLRIMPALLTVCALCIILLGPLLTRLPLVDYLRSPQSWSFLANAFFLPHDFSLPGVFEDRPYRAVNGSLWTLKFEVACYIAAALFLAVPRLRFILLGAAWLASFVLGRYVGESGAGIWFYLGAGGHLFRFFGAGMLLYLFRDRIPLRKDYGLIAAGICVASLFSPLFVEVVATFGSYALLVFGYNSPRWFRQITAGGDISYGVYVYAWPIQQLVAPLCIGATLGWLLNIALALPPTLAAGLASWLWIERPVLRTKPRAPGAQEVGGTR